MVDITLISIFINLVTCSFLSIFLLLTKNKYKTFIAFNVSLIFWGLFYALSIGTKNPVNALFYMKACFIFIILIPYLTLVFCAEIAEYNIKRSIKYIQFFAALTLIVLMPTSLLVKGVKPFMDFRFVPDVNWVWYFIPAYFAINVCSGLFILFKRIKTHIRIKFFFFSTIVGFSGGMTNFFPYLGIPVYPVGNVLISIYSIVITYLMLKHRLFDSSIVIGGSIARLLTLATLGGVYVILTMAYGLIITSDGFLATNFLNVVFLIISCESYQFLMGKFQEMQDKVLPRKSFEYGFISKKISQDLSNIISLMDLQKVLSGIFEDNLRLKIKTLYIVDKCEANKDFDGKEVSNLMMKKCFGDDIEDDLIKEIKSQISYLTTTVRYGELPLPLLQKVFDRTGSSCYIPFVAHDGVIGFMLVCQRSKNHYFNYNDMLLFDNLVFQTGAALDRAKLHVKVLDREREIQEEKSKVLRSLGGTIAHEMRNPLNAINMIMAQISDYIRELSKNNISDTKSGISELTRIADNSIDRTNKIINITLNELKGEEPDKDTFVPLSSIEVIKNAVSEYGYKSKLEKEKVIIEDSSDFTLKGDETILIYVLFNLIKNALYYLNEYPESTITIKTVLTAKIDNKEYNAIYVRDTGPGIPENRVDKLFDDFSTSGKKGGTGLGLAFCLRTMKSFGGDIKCESELGEYTEFILYFPKLSDEEISEFKTLEKVDDEGTHKITSATKRILIVDDEKVNIMVVKALVDSNFNNIICDIANDGKEAIKQFQSHKENPYDLILMDLQMPVMNGLETSKEIRKSDDNVPIVAYTSRISNESKKEALSVGIDNYLIKPSDNDLILKTISKWLIIKNNISYDKDQISDILENKTVLIADDEKINLMMLSRSLEKYGLKVDKANDGQELYDQYLAKKHDLIIADINMPNMTGGEVAKKIREHEIDSNLDRIPIIAYSGDDDKDLIHKTFRDSMDDFFVKSGNKSDDLIQMIAFWMASLDKSNSYKSSVGKKENNSKDKPSAEDENVNLDNLKIINDNLPKENLVELIPVFIESANRLIKEIRGSNDSQDVEQFFISSHALKGISGNLGADKFYQYMVYINKFARQKLFPDESEWIEKLDAIYEETQNELNNIVENT